MNTNQKIIYKDLSYAVVGLAMEVYNELGYGFLEKVYENALMVALQEAGIFAEQQKSIPVYFRSKQVGEYFADILVEGKIILELKSVEAINEIHFAQIIHYLKATNLKLGLIINFGKNALEHKRVVL
jgi:GxxExxY protein